MKRMLIVARRELAAYFAAPLFWVLSAFFLALFGLVFGLYFGQAQGVQASMRPLLELVGTILLFVTPLLSMRLLAEEQHTGTLELLMTSPVHDWQVVLGKWLAAVIALCVMLGFTLFHLAILSQLATNGMDRGELIGSYLGVVLLGASLLALGTLTSALTENQVVAGFLGIMLVMILWFVRFGATVAGEATRPGTILKYISVSDHYTNLGTGAIDSRDIVYFVTLTIGALYVATRVLETRRWR